MVSTHSYNRHKRTNKSLLARLSPEETFLTTDNKNRPGLTEAIKSRLQEKQISNKEKQEMNVCQELKPELISK